MIERTHTRNEWITTYCKKCFQEITARVDDNNPLCVVCQEAKK